MITLRSTACVKPADLALATLHQRLRARGARGDRLQETTPDAQQNLALGTPEFMLFVYDNQIPLARRSIEAGRLRESG